MQKSLLAQLTFSALIVGGVVSSALADLQGTGQWTSITDPNHLWPEVPIHAHLIPVNSKQGQVLFWGRGYPRNSGDSQTNPVKPYFWDYKDPTPASFTPAPVPSGYNAFCSGHAFLAGGKLLVAGGHDGGSDQGLTTAKKFNPQTLSWELLTDMNARWYPTVTALPDGGALVISGTNTIMTSVDPELTPQVLPYNAISGTPWRDLTEADMNVFAKYYPFMFVAPPAPSPSDYRVFVAGPGKKTGFLNTVSGGWGPFISPLWTAARNWGSAVMYLPGKILVMGGADCDFYASCLPVKTSVKIDLTAPSPTWTNAGDMAGPRKLHTATILANGKVLVTGGRRDMAGPKAIAPPPTPGGDAAVECEIWDPSGNGSWSLRANLPKYRGYHSIALLLPDATVLSAGGDHAGGNYYQSDDDDRTAEIFKPGYFFSHNTPMESFRPTITSVPSAGINYNQSFQVGFTVSDQLKTITKVNLVAVGSVTHGFNMGQRFVPLSFPTPPPGNGTLTVTAPHDENEAPPGYYMLFIFDSTSNMGGVPSVAKFVKVNLP